MRTIKLMLAAAVLSGGVFATAASAMPIAPISSDGVANIEQVRMVCNPYGRCWWRPNHYGGYGAHAQGFYGPPRHHGGWHHRRDWGRRW